MDNKEFSKELEKRTRKFAVQIIKISAKLPNTPEGRVVRTQLTKAGSSVGANYREANRARSRADFRNKIRICEGEANETQFWLEVIRDLMKIAANYLLYLLQLAKVHLKHLCKILIGEK